MDDMFVSSRLGRIHLRATGQGQTLFLMHSAGRSAYEFDDLAQRLQGRFRVIAWDMPGHGDSDRLPGSASISDFAKLALEVAGQVSEGPAIFAGGSVGAAIALAVADLDVDIAGVVPIELPLSRDAAWWRNNWFMIETMFAVPDEPDDRVRARYREVSPELALRLRIDRHKAGARGMMQLLWAGRADADAIQGRISRLRMPALFVNGERGVAPEASDLLSRIQPHARLAIIPDSGHFPHTDDPDAVAAAITRTMVR